MLDVADIKNKIDSGIFYTATQVASFLKEIDMDFKKLKNNKGVRYMNIPCAFDIETTSFTDKNGLKCSIMYEWTLGINWTVMIGRTWEELLKVLEEVSNYFELSKDNRLIIYIHNESFEFQAMRKHFEWESVFSVKDRKPVQAITTNGIEFRCSYILSGYSLRSLGENLTKYKVEKMVGDLNYSLLRSPITPLTDKEIRYCLNDVYVVMAYIQETIEKQGNITKIPLTKTGYVRKYCKNSCFYDDTTHRENTGKFKVYRSLMKELTIEPKEYEVLKKAFQGGFTHANPFKSRGTFYDVHSFDFTSSYPAVMIAERFPMSKGERVIIKDVETFKKHLNLYCCAFTIAFRNIRSKLTYENYISVSHCELKDNVYENNGRVVCADYIKTTITELDFFIIRHFYEWDEIELYDFYRYRKGYLPTDFVKSILQLYVDKTTLKGVKGEEENYLLSKERINSAYGMTVTDICRDKIQYDGEWSKESCDIETEIDRYNRSTNRFLFYPWGVWVTAYARFNLFTGIIEFGNDYIYSDTDSIKVKNVEKHKEYFKLYNEDLTNKLRKAMEHHRLPFDMTRPKTIKGIEKPIGVWDEEPMYSRFKTVGAKRYITECCGEISITVSGVNKHTAVPYLKAKYGDKIFENFDDDLEIPAYNDLGFDIFTDSGELIENPCGKMTHTYIDGEINGTIVDYLGNKYTYKELSGTHLENCGYSLSLAQKYVDFLLSIEEDFDYV